MTLMLEEEPVSGNPPREIRLRVDFMRRGILEKSTLGQDSLGQPFLGTTNGGSAQIECKPVDAHTSWQPFRVERLDTFRYHAIADQAFTVSNSDAWFKEALRQYSIGETARAMDAVNDTIDDWFCAGQFSECDAFLSRVDVENTPPVLLLAILTVTYHAHEKLDNRDEVFERAWDTLRRHGKDCNKLLNRLRAKHGMARKRSSNIVAFTHWS